MASSVPWNERASIHNAVGVNTYTEIRHSNGHKKKVNDNLSRVKWCQRGGKKYEWNQRAIPSYISVTPHSEPVQLDVGLRNPIFRKEVGNLEPLITLKLNDLTHLLVVNESTVAGEFLLECF